MAWGGPVSVSPFLALLGGSNHNNQTFVQTIVQGPPPVTNWGPYSANTSLTWNDFGGRLGLDATAPLASWLAWSFSGSVGIADRMVSLIGSDSISVFGLPPTSAVSGSATTTAFMANLETGFAVKALPSLTLRAFGGVNFDNRVPGISQQQLQFNGAPLPPPASISFSNETSYYAGGGASWRF